MDIPKQAARRRRLYCLRCFADLPGLRTPCTRCGFASRPSDRQLYWNRSPWIGAVERTLKLATIVVVGLLCLGIAVGPGHAGVGAGFAIGAPMFLGVLLWKTLSKLTRHGANWQPAIAWSALLLLCCTLPWLLYLDHGVKASQRITLWDTVLADGVLVVLAGFVHLVARCFGRWKRRLVAGARDAVVG